MKKVILVISFLFASFIVTNAQTCVYYCSSTGAAGWAHGYSNSCEVARSKCINFGGKSPHRVISTESKGYGAIYFGTNSNGDRVIGASAGYSNLQTAKNKAKSACKNKGGRNVYCKDSWNDR